MAKIKPTSKAHFDVTHENMIRAVIAFALAAANVAITNSIAAFATLINTLNGNITTIDSLRASIAQPIKGYAAQKKAVKTALAAMSANIMKAAYTYAVNTGNDVLAAQMKISQSQLLSMKYVDIVTFVQGAIDIVNTEISNLSTYNVTPADVTVWQTVCTQLDTLISNPKNAIANRKQVNENIQTLLRQCMVILYNNTDELAFQFRTNNLNYYNNYRANRRLYPHHMSTQLRINVIDRFNNPVTQGEVFIEGTPLSAFLDENGYAMINHIPFGYHKVYVTSIAGELDAGIQHFKKGKSLSLNVQVGVGAGSKVTTKVTVTETDTPVIVEK